jgi:hypothetical protein
MTAWLKTIALALLVAANFSSATAADVTSPTFAIRDADASAAALEGYLDRKAMLLLLRARFDVLTLDDVPAMLAEDAGDFAVNGPSEEAIASVGNDLEAEGLFAIVQLRYLIQSGGSLWPTDKPEDTYVNDALAELRQLQWELPEVLAAGDDPYPLFQRIDQINAWTEGYADLPDELDHYSTRDSLVDAALAEAAPVSL